MYLLELTNKNKRNRPKIQIAADIVNILLNKNDRQNYIVVSRTLNNEELIHNHILSLETIDLTSSSVPDSLPLLKIVEKSWRLTRILSLL